MSKFKVGDVVVRAEDFDITGMYECCTGKPVKIMGIIRDHLIFCPKDGGDGWWAASNFELYKPPFNPLADPWYILTPTKEAFEDAVAWAKSVGLEDFTFCIYTEGGYYIRNSEYLNIRAVSGTELDFRHGSCDNHKQITLTKSISYEYNIVEEETEEQKEAKKKAEEINAVRIEMEALAKRLKDLEG
jgi:hypothetical protein